MDNQHQKIKGYRELSQAEIDLMNEVKAKGEELRTLVAKISDVLGPQPEATVDIAHEADSPHYWLRYAEGSYRCATMYAVRAIAQPTSY
jgi:hypothetical protein